MRRAALVATLLVSVVLPAGANASGAPASARRAAVLALLFRHVPEPGIGSILQGVYCTSRANCWAVGDYNPAPNVSLNEILHWNGRAWARVPAPSPTGTASRDMSDLTAVRCPGPRDCWAVGTYHRGFGPVFSQMLHWTGRKWFRAAIPAAPGGTSSGDVSELLDVVCASSADCWAVGDFGVLVNRIVVHNEALHWNGKKWSMVKMPDPAGTAAGDLNSLGSIRCPSAANCIAVGAYGTFATTLNEALRWNGRRWLTLTAPNPAGTGGGDLNSLIGLACSSSANCWAVGTAGSVTGPSASLQNQILHWNGTAWAQVTAPAPEGIDNKLLFVTCLSAVNCWTVGNSSIFDAQTETQLASNQALHWDGGTWSLVSTPDPGGAALGDFNELNAIRCPSGGNCWAVGDAAKSGAQDSGQILHWDGATWSVR